MIDIYSTDTPFIVDSVLAALRARDVSPVLLAHPVLMLDEVLSGLTPSEIDEAVALIRRIRDQGATIVFVEHVMRAVMALCDRVVIFDRG